MRNLRKFLAVLLVVMLSVTAIVPAFAVPTASTPVEVAEKLGLLEGSDDGITDEYLAREPERIQAAIVLLRLMGEDDKEINAEYKGKDNFSDYAESAWAEGIMAYLKENPELGFSGNNGKFFPRQKITAQQFYKVLLTALGYTQITAENPDGDFKWEETITFAKFVGLKELNGKTSLTNEDLAIGITEALVLPIVGDELTLAEDLAFSGAIDFDAAVELGLVDALPTVAEVLPAEDVTINVGATLVLPETVKVKMDNDEVLDAAVEWDVTAVDVNKAGEYKVEGTIDGTDLKAEVKVTVKALDVTATAEVKGAKKIVVTFNTPVDTTKAQIAVKSGVVTLASTVKFDDAKKVATVELSNTIAAGSYSVVISGLDMKTNTLTVVAANETLTTIAFAGDSLIKSAAAPFSYKLFNQYGEEFVGAKPTVQITAYHYTGAVTVKNDNTVDLSSTNIKPGDTVIFTAVSGTAYVTKEFKVTDAASVSLTMTGVVSDNTKAADRSKLYDFTTDNANKGIITFEAKDQYGTVITQPGFLSAIQFYSSFDKVQVQWAVRDSKAVIEVTVANGALTNIGNFPVTVTAIGAGKVYGTFQFTVYAKPAVASVSIAAPTGVIAIGDTNVDFVLTGVDQYGNAVSAADIEAAKSTISVIPSGYATLGTPTIINDNGVAKVRFAGPVAGLSGNSTVTVLKGTAAPQSASIAVQPARFAQKIEFAEGKTKLAPSTTKNADSVLKYKLFDQYGAEYKVDTGVATEYTATKVSGDDAVTLATNDLRTITVTGIAGKAAEYDITAVVKKDGNVISSLATRVKVINKDGEKITYAVADIPTLYKGGAAGNEYAKAITVTAKDAAGNDVAVPNAVASVVTSNGTNVPVAVSNAVYSVYGVNATGNAVTSVLTITLDTVVGSQVVVKTATVSKDDLAVSSVVAKDGDGNVKTSFEFGAKTVNNFFTDDKIKFVVNDQFGGTSLSAFGTGIAQIVIVSKDGSANKVITSSADQSFTFVKDKTYVITVVPTSGSVLQVEVKAN